MPQAAHRGSEEIAQRDSPPSVDHLERDAHDQLQDEIVGDVDESFVQEGVREEAPGFVAAKRIVDQRRMNGRGTRERKLLHRDGVVHVETDFDETDEDDEQRRRTASVIFVVRFGRHRLNGVVQNAMRQIQVVHFKLIFVTNEDHVAKLL